MLYLFYRDPISIFISSWDYYEYDKKLEMTIEEFAYAVGEGILNQSRYQLPITNYKLLVYTTMYYTIVLYSKY